MNAVPTKTVQMFLDEARFLDTKLKMRHDMAHFVCGSTSCAVGDMMLAGLVPIKTEADGGELFPPAIDGNTFEWLARSFGISRSEVAFLFSYDWPHMGILRRSRKFRGCETPQITAARIRKYVYYKLHKADILSDYERARHQEGDWNVCQQVTEMVYAS